MVHMSLQSNCSQVDLVARSRLRIQQFDVRLDWVSRYRYGDYSFAAHTAGM
mgnify:CR=1 FL=1